MFKSMPFVIIPGISSNGSDYLHIAVKVTNTLTEYVDNDHLPSQLGGKYNYDHAEFVATQMVSHCFYIALESSCL